MEVNPFFRIIPIFFILSISICVYGQKNVRFSYGDGIDFIAPDSSASCKFRFRFQNRYMAKRTLNNNSGWDSDIKIRRARLKFDGFAVSPRLQYKIEIALSNDDLYPVYEMNGHAGNLMLDAVAKWEAFPDFEIWIGQAKLPGNRERVISSQNLQFVDRSLVNRNFNIDRDVGFQFRYHFHAGSWLIREQAAVTQGEGRNIIVENKGGYNYTGRLEVLPFGVFAESGDYFSSDLSRESTPKLSLCAGYNYNNRAARAYGQRGELMPENRTLKTMMADLMFKYRGFSVMSEYIHNSAKDAWFSPDNAFVTGEGFVIQGGYLFKNNLEVAGRYTTVTPEHDEQPFFKEVNEYTLGLSKYISGHSLKVQSDISLQEIPGQKDRVMQFRMQMEVGI